MYETGQRKQSMEEFHECVHGQQFGLGDYWNDKK
jgi:hypothetical protein